MSRAEIKLCLLLADMNEHIELSMSVRVVRDDPRQSSSRSRNREKLPKNLRRALVFQKMPCFFVAGPLTIYHQVFCSKWAKIETC